MIISIISGGSGSANIQKGLYEIFPKIEINLLINGYDDGKSTGILRQLFPNTLGISDFRKNQILEYKLLYGNNNIYNLLNNRFTHNNPLNYIVNLINNTNFNDTEKLKTFLLDNVEYFFKTEQSKQIIYNDFSFMNIIYCSLLDKYNNNMEIVCEIIKNILGLKNNIYVNSNENLILKGITKHGKILLDEGSIVDFNDKNDKIIDVFFDKDYPILNKKTQELLLRSNIILFSCGTQFSSLIPTYKTLLFKETINNSKASKFLVLNCDYDNDIINYSGDELLDKIDEYLPLNDIQIIISNDMNKTLFPTNPKYNYINIQSLIVNKQHNGFLIWKYIFKHYFKTYYNKFYIFDYDYTLYDNKFIEISKENINLLKSIHNKIIITSNCYSNLLPITDINIYSNFGNLYNNNNYIDETFIFNDKDIDNLNKIIDNIEINKNYLIANRKNISISIKPIQNRNELINMLTPILLNSNYEIVKTGKTTIEFIKKGLSKRNIFNIKHFLEDNHITYISDINDIEYSSSDNIKFLKVDNIHTTNLFLKSIIINQKYDFCIVVGGINKRMNIDYPKCLIQVDNEIVLIKIINNIMPYANNIFICGNNYYKNSFVEFEKSIKSKSYNNIKFLYFNSIDSSQTYPKGNGETIYQLLTTISDLSNKLFIMWGDIIISDNKIFEEMYNYQYNNNFLIPTKYEKNPYAYLIIDNKNKVTKIEYKKNINIDYGYHDQCIFLCDKHKIKEKLEMLINQNYEELNFLDIINHLDNIYYFETKYPLNSFNTIYDL
jgi:choline kinase